MIITLVKKNDKFSRGLKTTMAETLNLTYQNTPEKTIINMFQKKDFKIIGNGF